MIPVPGPGYFFTYLALVKTDAGIAFFVKIFQKFFFRKGHIIMFLDPLNPDPTSVFRFEASVPRYVNFYHEIVNFFKMPFYHTAVVDWQNIHQISADRHFLQTATTTTLLQSETMNRILAAARVRCLAESGILVGHRRLGIANSFARLRLLIGWRYFAPFERIPY